MMMTIAATCGKCGYRIQTELGESVETSNLMEARLFLVEQTQQHTHSGENFKLRLGWSDRSGSGLASTTSEGGKRELETSDGG